MEVWSNGYDEGLLNLRCEFNSHYLLITMKQCSKCKELKDESKFYYKDKAKGKLQSYCKVCLNKAQVVKLQNKKKLIVEYLGGKCVDCDLVDHPCVYDCHHLEDDKKDFGIAQKITRSFEKLRPELNKCVLLCANCHRKRHLV